MKSIKMCPLKSLCISTDPQRTIFEASPVKIFGNNTFEDSVITCGFFSVNVVHSPLFFLLRSTLFPSNLRASITYMHVSLQLSQST